MGKERHQNKQEKVGTLFSRECIEILRTCGTFWKKGVSELGGRRKTVGGKGKLQKIDNWERGMRETALRGSKRAVLVGY